MLSTSISISSISTLAHLLAHSTHYFQLDEPSACCNLCSKVILALFISARPSSPVVQSFHTRHSEFWTRKCISTVRYIGHTENPDSTLWLWQILPPNEGLHRWDKHLNKAQHELPNIEMEQRLVALLSTGAQCFIYPRRCAHNSTCSIDSTSISEHGRRMLEHTSLAHTGRTCYIYH